MPLTGLLRDKGGNRHWHCYSNHRKSCPPIAFKQKDINRPQARAHDDVKVTIIVPLGKDCSGAVWMVKCSSEECNHISGISCRVVGLAEPAHGVETCRCVHVCDGCS